MAEADLVAEVLTYLSRMEFLVWRNNTGQFWACRREGAKLIPVRPVKCGLKGSGDVIGFCRRCGVFIGVECKYDRNVPSEEQVRFLEFLERAGGIAIAAWTIDEVREQLAARHTCHG